ncbi:hypothetical protein GWK47_055143 [Chionoecetes opilio]|uniref:Uncharacterized protein n=1 Tax=Chionoecetes opilio TaxID=41210 RepID=A0A8J4XZU6_CHIOP|nr:hypothetical protein GWK47_055143 [Chionoecetes opilio]
MAASPLSPAAHIALSAARQSGPHTLFGGFGGKLVPLSSPPSSPLMAAAAAVTIPPGHLYSPPHHHAGRGRYRQDRIRTQMSFLKAEAATLEAMLESGTLSDLEAAKVEVKIGSRRNEAERLQKELERLISGQLRQRKFRERMRKKMAASSSAVPDSA